MKRTSPRADALQRLPDRIPTMHTRLSNCLALTALSLVAVGLKTVHSEDPRKPPTPAAPTPPQPRKAIERGLAFLEQDAAKWRKERKCASCHHGVMTVW